MSEFFRIMAAQTLKISISLADSDVQTFLDEKKKTNKRKGKPKVTYSMVLAMTFLAAENENRQLTYFSRVPEIFLPLVRNKSKPENFVY